MHNRLRLLMGATALLYLGPLLAGLGGFGWAIVPVFTAIFVLWLIILRPNQWPRSLAEWQSPEALVTFAAQTAVQVLLVTVCFGIGRGLGGVLGALPPFPLMLPVAVSFLAIPLARMIWDPWKAGEIDSFLDKALDQIAGRVPSGQSDRLALAETMLQPVQAMADSVDVAELERHLAAIRVHTDHEAIRDVLLSAAKSGTASKAGLRALLVHATDPAVVEILGGSAYPALAFAAINSDPGLQELFANRCRALLDDDTGAWWDCPTAEAVQAAADASQNPQTADSLRRLAGLLTRVTPDSPASDHAG